MMRNDLIQGIVFDAKQTITFKAPPTTKLSKLFFDIKRQVNKTKKSYHQKKLTPFFSTDLMPSKPISKTTTPSQKTANQTKRIVLR